MPTARSVAYEVSTQRRPQLDADDGGPERPGRRQLSVPRRGHRPGRQQLDQQCDRRDRRQHGADRGHAAFSNLTDSGSSDSPPVTQDGTFDLSLSGDADANGTAVWPMKCRPMAARPGRDDGGAEQPGRRHYQFRAVVTDRPATARPATPIRVIVDNTAPTAGTLAFANLTDTGAADSTADHPGRHLRSQPERRHGRQRRPAWPMKCRLNGGSLIATTASQSGLADGSYQFRAVVTDRRQQLDQQRHQRDRRQHGAGRGHAVRSAT